MITENTTVMLGLVHSYRHFTTHTDSSQDFAGPPFAALEVLSAHVAAYFLYWMEPPKDD